MRRMLYQLIFFSIPALSFCADSSFGYKGFLSGSVFVESTSTSFKSSYSFVSIYESPHVTVDISTVDYSPRHQTDFLTNPMTFSLSVSGENPYVALGCHLDSGTPPGIVGLPTVGGVSMVLLSSGTMGGDLEWYTYGLAGVASGSKTVSITMNDPEQNVECEGVVFDGVNQSNPVYEVKVSTSIVEDGSSYTTTTTPEGSYVADFIALQSWMSANMAAYYSEASRQIYAAGGINSSFMGMSLKPRDGVTTVSTWNMTGTAPSEIIHTSLVLNPAN